MDFVPAPVACAYGASVLKKHVEAMRQEFDGVRSGELDIEYIHRLRVASRRFRSALALFEGCFEPKRAARWQKEIRRLTRSLGAARDTDVQLDVLNSVLTRVPERRYRMGIRRIMLRLNQNRKRLNNNLRQVLDELVQMGTFEDIEIGVGAYLFQNGLNAPYSIDLYFLAAEAITKRLNDLFQYRDCVYHPEQMAELHLMRITAKRLRYTLEALNLLYEDKLQTYIKLIRNVQDALGIIHDCDVWAEWIPQFLERERQRIEKFYGHARPYGMIYCGVEHFRQNRQAERERVFLEFQQAWEDWRRERVWDGLVERVKRNLETQAPQAETLQAI